MHVYGPFLFLPLSSFPCSFPQGQSVQTATKVAVFGYPDTVREAAHRFSLLVRGFHQFLRRYILSPDRVQHAPEST